MVGLKVLRVDEAKEVLAVAFVVAFEVSHCALISELLLLVGHVSQMYCGLQNWPGRPKTKIIVSYTDFQCEKIYKTS